MRLLLLFLVGYSWVDVTAAPSSQEVTALLGGYEWELSIEMFEALPEDTYLTLMKIASDPMVLSFYRGRAVAALSLYQNDEVWLFFKKSIGEALSQNEREVESRRTLEAMCKTFASSRGDELKKLLRPWLLKDDSHFRVQTATCLQDLQSIYADEATKIALQNYKETIIQKWERDKVFR
ncbi:MAG: hypothetical protein JKY88_01600 [Pseudomonadales bacterium]|nr:hypothetical protein [Pseudomonadales bacterium]